MAGPANMFRPADTLFAGTPTALQLRMYLGELIGTFNRKRQLSPLVDSKTIEAGLSWDGPAYGHMEEGGYHSIGEDILISNQLHRVPMVNKRFLIDDPFLLNGFVPDFDEFQLHYSGREVWNKQAAEGHVKTNDMKCARMLIKAARAAPNIPAAGAITAAMATPAGSSAINVGGNTAPTTSSNAAMLTSGSVVVAALKGIAQQAMEREIPADTLVAALHPAEYFNILDDRQLLDRDVQAVGGSNGDFPMAKVYYAYGIKLMPSTAVKAVRDGGNYGGVTGENNSYIADFSKNAGIVFAPDAVQRLIRKEMEMQMWYQQSRFGYVTTTRMIDGFGIKKPECAFEISTP